MDAGSRNIQQGDDMRVLLSQFQQLFRRVIGQVGVGAGVCTGVGVGVGAGAGFWFRLKV